MKILKEINIDNLLFIDIETVQLVKDLEEGTPLYDSFAYKVKYNKDAIDNGEKSYQQLFNEQAQLYPEFSKIVCVTIGKIQDNILKVKSYYDENEHKLLSEVNSVLNNILSANKKTVLCGHFIIGFDIPFLMTRSIINGIEPATLIDIAHLKPWEVNCVDTHNLWKGTSIRSASLINIAVALGLPSPKDEMFGYEVSNVFYNEKDGLERIRIYCEKDVLTVANIVRKCRFEDTVEMQTTDMKVKKVGTLDRIFATKLITPADEKVLANIIKELPIEEQKAAKDILDVALPKKVK